MSKPGGGPSSPQVAFTAPPGKPPPRLYEIDLLRIVAALAVVFFHYTFSGFEKGQTGVAFPTAGEFAKYGYLGVDLFFVISGFVVLLSAWSRKPEQFVVSRIVRLYPAFWVAVTLTTIVSVTLSQGMFEVSPVQYLANMTMFNAVPGIENVDVVYWTLWAEIRFYLIIFLLTCFGITRRRLLGVLWAWLAATFVLQSGFVPESLHGPLEVLIQTQFSHYFIAGMALCIMYKSGQSWSLWAIIAISLGNAIYRAIEYADAVGLRYQSDMNPVVIAAIITAIFGLVTLIALGVTNPLARSWFSVAGSLTYPLYLIHAHVGFVIFSRFHEVVNPYVLLFGTIAVMCLTAYLIYRTAELRFGPVLKRFVERPAKAIRTRLSPPSTVIDDNQPADPRTVPNLRPVDATQPIIDPNLATKPSKNPPDTDSRGATSLQ